MTRILTSEQTADIEALRTNPMMTLRPTSPGAEDVIHKPFFALDHGMIRLVDYMGTDESVPQAARTSYGKGTKAITNDEGLIRYLMRHNHSTPFEMITAKFHVICPIFVARQWLRHRTGSFNEYSARYSVMEREFYIPEAAQLAAQSKQNNQGRGDILGGEEAKRVLELLKHDASMTYDHYEEMINLKEDPSRDGLARELARMNLPVSIYTQFYWSVNMWNLLHFLRLRADSHAQYEIRIYAQIMLDDILKPWVPMTLNAFTDYKVGAVTLSRQAKDMISAALSGQSPDTVALPAKRELNEILESFPALRSWVEGKA